MESLRLHFPIPRSTFEVCVQGPVDDTTLTEGASITASSSSCLSQGTVSCQVPAFPSVTSSLEWIEVTRRGCLSDSLRAVRHHFYSGNAKVVLIDEMAQLSAMRCVRSFCSDGDIIFKRIVDPARSGVLSWGASQTLDRLIFRGAQVAIGAPSASSVVCSQADKDELCLIIRVSLICNLWSKLTSVIEHQNPRFVVLPDDECASVARRCNK